MIFVIVILILLILGLSRKYILRLEPAGMFSLWWMFSSGMAVVLNHYIIQRYTGTIFILFCVLAFTLGTKLCDMTQSSESVEGENVLSFRKERAAPLLVVLILASMFNPLYSLYLHGFSFTSLFNMALLLHMNSEMSVDRYSGADTYSVLNQFFLVFSYLSPVIGGFCYRMVGRWTKILCIVTVIPGIFVALTQAMKMGMIVGFILWFAGYVVCSFSYRLSLRVKFRYFFFIILGFFLFLAILFLSLVFRTGELSTRALTDISQKFVTYALGHHHCFDLWYSSYELSEHTYGAMTFMGVSNLLGITNRVSGIYTEFTQIGTNGFYGISNVYTIFRPLIEDFGEPLTVVILFVFGFCSDKARKSINRRSATCFCQTFLVAVYIYVLWSFVASIYAYTSILTMFAFAYFVFLFLQKQEPSTSTKPAAK